jgi:ubiquinone/menaquinone biosynthesis C-methylase UbiE
VPLRFASLVICLSIFVSTLSAQTTNVPDKRSAVPADINNKFTDPNVDAEEWAKRFEGESREVAKHRDEVVKAIGLSAGSRIADLGAGTGLFLKPFSDGVTKTGKVYALEISEGLLRYMRQRVEREGLENVEVLLSKEDSTELPADSVDVVFLCDVYHHFEYHEAMLRSMHKALSSGGQIVLVEFERIPGKTKKWIVDHVRAGKEVFIKEIEQAGFEFVEEMKISGFTENYCLRFRKP